MKLNASERIQVLQLLPEVGDYTILRILREMQKSLGFTEEEQLEFNVRRVEVEGGTASQWGPEIGKSEEENKKLIEAISKEKEIKLGDKAIEIVKVALLDLEKAKKLKRNLHETLYEKFVQDKVEEKKEEKSD